MPHRQTSDHAQAYWRDPVTITGSVDPQEPQDLATELTRLAEFLPTLSWIALSDGSIFWYNQRWHDYTGTEPETMKGWGWQSVHDPDVLPDVIAGWTGAIRDGQPFEMMFPLRGADGNYRTFLTRVIPIRDTDGVIVRWLGTNAEISAQVRAERALAASEAKYEVLTNAMPQMVWSTLPDGFHDYYNDQWYEFTGVAPGSTDGAGWNGMFHPDDQERALARWQHSLDTGEAYEIEYRLRHHSGTYRWVLGRAQAVRDTQGAITRWIGTCTDIDDGKRAAEQNELLSRELSHRIKNIFAVVSGLINLTAHRSGEAKPALTALLGRIRALAQAHEFARPHSPHSQPTSLAGSLQGLLVELLSAYGDEGTARITVTGDDVPIDDRSATPLALVVHELATNSAKYGALSAEDGTLSVTSSLADDELTLTWSEHGGPDIAAQPERVGFGTELAELSIKRQLGGTITRNWRPSGLQVTVVLQASLLHRPF